MSLSCIDLDHACERLSHRIAYCIHYMLAEANVTVDELKARIAKFPKSNRETTPEIIDAVLTATRPEIVTCSALGDIAFALEFELDFKIVKIAQEVETATAEVS